MSKILNSIGIDGLLHFVVSAFIMVALCLYVPSIIAFFITFAIGLAKEFIWDKWMRKGSFEIKDIVCDLFGIMLGIVTYGLSPLYIG